MRRIETSVNQFMCALHRNLIGFLQTNSMFDSTTFNTVYGLAVQFGLLTNCVQHSFVFVRVIMATSARTPFLLSTLYTQIILTISQTNTQIELTPSSISSISDITVTPGEDCDIIGDVWSIDVTQQAGADLAISLGPTYGFHADYASTISITLNGNTSNHSYENDCDVSLIFAVNDFYFAHFFHLDSTRHKYKECPASSNALIARNVTEMVINESPDRYHRFCNNSVGISSDIAGDYWSAVSPTYKEAVEWPMNIVIHNNPNTNTVEYTWSDASTSTNGQVTSSYATSFDTEQGLDIFIAGDNNGEDFIITSIDINYQYTVPPTPAPTVSPIPDPTSHPTQPPTTAAPTPSPIPVPTAAPSLPPPTTSPTEPAPTSTPSKSPTNKPTTKAPTMDLVISEPTVSPSESPDNSTNSVISKSGATTLELSLADHWGYVIAGSVMLCMGIVCGFMLLVLCKKRQRRGSFSPKVADWNSIRGSRSHHNGSRNGSRSGKRYGSGANGVVNDSLFHRESVGVFQHRKCV